MDRPRLLGWREVERYSVADPCDPASYRAANVDETEDRYTALDVSTLRTGMGVTTEDHFFTGARPAVARFAERTAIERHRALAAQIVTRTGLARRQGRLELRAHTALLGADDARALLETRLRLPAATENDVQMIASTIVRAHHCAAGAKGGLRKKILAVQKVASRPRSTSSRTGAACP